MVYTKIIFNFIVKYSEQDESSKEPDLVKRKVFSELAVSSDNVILHTNQPYLLATYKTQGSLDDNLIILCPMVSGARNIRFQLADDGSMCFIKYNWPNIMLSIDNIFKKEKEIAIPKIIALEEQLSMFKETQNGIPESIIQIKFPFTVHPSTSDHVVVGIEEDGCKMLRIELPAYNKKYGPVEQKITF